MIQRELDDKWLIEWHNRGNAAPVVELLTKYYKKPIKDDLHIWNKLDNAMKEIDETGDYKGFNEREATELFWYGRLAKPAILTLERIKIEERKKKIKNSKVKRCRCK